MLIPIKIDLDDLVQEFDLDGSQIKFLGMELTNRISDKYFAAIKQKVNTTLKSTRGIYLKNLRIETIDDLTKEIILSGWLSNAIESGITTFDMKPGFQTAKNVKISLKGNWYTTIPFLWSKNEGIENKQKLPFEINELVNKQKSPLKETQIPESQRLHQIKDLARGIGAKDIPKAQGLYQHQNSIYTGIQKTDNGIISFRRVGAISFWHPGIVKQDFFGKALDEISSEIPILADKIIDDFIQNI